MKRFNSHQREIWYGNIMPLEITLRLGRIEIVELLVNAGDIWRDEQNSDVSALPKIIEEIISEEHDPRDHERLAQGYSVFSESRSRYNRKP